MFHAAEHQPGRSGGRCIASRLIVCILDGAVPLRSAAKGPASNAGMFRDLERDVREFEFAVGRVALHLSPHLNPGAEWE
jgi:hypothetical protein